MLYDWETICPDKIYLRQPIDDVWKTWTWKQTGEEVRKLAGALKGMNLPPGSNIAMISKNCAHWIITDLAVMMAGHTFVPLYPNLNDQTIRQILEHSGAKILFVGKLDNWKSMKAGVPDAVRCISFPLYGPEGYETWESFVHGQEPLLGNIDRNPKELATIIYTSGTTGMPKGVMHSFHSLSFAVSYAMPHMNIRHDARFFSYLPLSHIAERLLVEMGSLCVGGEVSFAESIEKFQKNLAEAKPSVFLGVHRIWTKFQQGILLKLPQHKLNIYLRIPILSGMIKGKIRASLGLTEAMNILSGASPTPVALLKWFKSVGIRIQESYATTEDCCYSHVTLANWIKIGCVGQSLPECEVRLSEENEILIRHEALLMGYYKEPEMSKEVFTEDGFLRTGDEGKIDQDGFLKITGRVKDIFKTAKGKYVAPSPIEMKLLAMTDIEQVCVVGSTLAQPIAMVVLSDRGRKRSREELAEVLHSGMLAVNTTLDHHEHLHTIVVMKRDWTVENGMLTPTLKVKRRELEKVYSSSYENWYNQKRGVVWEENINS